MSLYVCVQIDRKFFRSLLRHSISLITFVRFSVIDALRDATLSWCGAPELGAINVAFREFFLIVIQCYNIQWFIHFRQFEHKCHYSGDLTLGAAWESPFSIGPCYILGTNKLITRTSLPKRSSWIIVAVDGSAKGASGSRPFTCLCLLHTSFYCSADAACRSQ